jgi:S1-C subfamily serine protease
VEIAMRYLHRIITVSLALVVIILSVVIVNNSGGVSDISGLTLDTGDDFLMVDSGRGSRTDNEESNTIKIYEDLNKAVVNITYYKTEYISYFFDMYPQTREGQGSGAIIDEKGLVVTNYHVVGDADRLTVALSRDDGVFDAEIVGIDPENDLAVIKIINPPDNLTVIPLGTSRGLKIGQKAYAIGNPFGLDRTLTAGIISGLGRPIKTENGNVIEGAIQTDASINPGNSGGPLLNADGLMIGLNTMIISPSGGSIGLGFAIPVETVREVVKDLVTYGYVKRGWIDATFLPVTPAISRSLGLKVDHGLMIMQVARNGQAAKAGLRGGNERAIYGNSIVYIGGDILTKVDGIKINDYSSLTRIMKDFKPGQTVSVEYWRNNRQNTAEVKLIDKSKFSQR